MGFEGLPKKNSTYGVLLRRQFTILGSISLCRFLEG